MRPAVPRGVHGVLDLDRISPAFESGAAWAFATQGVPLVRLRPGRTQVHELIGRCARLVPPLRDAGCVVLLERRPDLAMVLELDGVHLTEDDVPPEAARRLMGPEALIGACEPSAAADYLAVQSVNIRTGNTAPVVADELADWAACDAAIAAGCWAISASGLFLEGDLTANLNRALELYR